MHRSAFLWFVWGCSRGDDTLAGKVPLDTAAPSADSAADTGRLPQKDTGAEDSACRTDWPALADTATSACPLPEPDLSLVLAASHAVPLTVGTVQAARVGDIDGDGRISRQDPAWVWLLRYSPADKSGSLLADLHDHALVTQVSVDDQLGISSHLGAIGDLDGTPGVELLSSEYQLGAADSLSTYTSAGRQLSQHVFDASEDVLSIPWLFRAAESGPPRALLGAQVIDPSSGAVLATLSGAHGGINNLSVAADLDRDGEAELISVTDDGAVGAWAPDGSPKWRCEAGFEPGERALFAVGDLDGDGTAEVVSQSAGVAVVCDASGAAQATLAVPSTSSGGAVGIAELDGAPGREILLGLNVTQDPGGDRRSILLAARADLSERWRVTTPKPGWTRFVTADLDQDGRSEVVAYTPDALMLIDDDGTVRARYPLTSNNLWVNTPALVDIDGDDLAEIVLLSAGTLRVFENAQGGWLVDELDRPWTGINHHPGAREPDGSLPPTLSPWAAETSNIWQGLPLTVPCRPELRAELAEVCAPSCAEDGLVTVYVYNTGECDTAEEVRVSLRGDAGAELAAGHLAAPLPVGQGHAIMLTLPQASLSESLSVALDSTDRIEECDEENGTLEIGEVACGE